MIGRKIILLVILATLFVAVGAFTSVMAGEDDSTFRVVNKSHKDVQVEVYSRADITYGANDINDAGVVKIFNVPAGGSDDVLLDNDETYYYAYWACGPDPRDVAGYPNINNPNNVIDGEINMKEDVEIVINPCDHQPTLLEVRNHLGETVSLELVGYEEKTYDIEPGLTTISVYSGETIYKYDACDPVQDFNGVIDILATGRSDLLIRSCEYYLSPVFEFSAANVVSFRIINHASFPLILSVIGPMNDLIEISPGENRVTLVAGSYEYGYYMDYQLIIGNFFVSPNGNGIALLSPEYTIDYGLIAEEEFE